MKRIPQAQMPIRLSPENSTPFKLYISIENCIRWVPMAMEIRDGYKHVTRAQIQNMTIIISQPPPLIHCIINSGIRLTHPLCNNTHPNIEINDFTRTVRRSAINHYVIMEFFAKSGRISQCLAQSLGRIECDRNDCDFHKIFPAKTSRTKSSSDKEKMSALRRIFPSVQSHQFNFIKAAITSGEKRVRNILAGTPPTTE